MSSQDILQKIKECIVNLDMDGAIENVKKALENKISPGEIVSKSIVEGMSIVGEKFEKGEYFLSELIVAGEIGKEIVKLLDPYLKAEKAELKKLNQKWLKE